MHKPQIGVIVVNWNGLDDTRACLESLGAAAPGPAAVIVVDNGSTDGSLEALRTWSGSPDITLLEAGTNLGFAGANNLGIAHLAQDPAITHFFLLNNDATVDPDFFAQMAGALATVPDAGLIGPTIYVTGTRMVWYAGGRFVPWRALVVHEHAVPDSPTPLATAFVTGCAMLISRPLWLALGGLPTCYFIYLEDAEYSWRARAAGLPVLYAPAAVAHHAVGATVRRSYSNPRVAYWHTRHRALFARRNVRGWARWAALGYLIVTKPVKALGELLRGRPALGWAVLRGTAAGLLSKDGQREVHQPAAVQRPLDRPREHHRAGERRHG